MPTLGPRKPADADEFAQMLREHLPSAARLAVRLCGDVHAAEDLVGETMLRAVRARASFRGEAAFGTWLYAIVVNAFRDTLRSPAKRPVMRLAEADDPPDAGLPPEASAMAGELGRRVASHVSSLPPRQREALVLTLYEGLTADEAAAVMRTTAANVRVLAHHARSRLRQELADLMEKQDEPIARST